MKSLKGQFLIAMPALDDAHFAQSVIYLIDHSPQGAMGLVINDPLDGVIFDEIADDLNLLEATDETICSDAQNLKIGRGGPVDPGRGFVLHSHDYFDPRASAPVSASVVLTANRDILKAIAAGTHAPTRQFFALGYAGWGAGQLEAELTSNSWLNVAADNDILFAVPFGERYGKALGLLGLNAANLSAMAGQA